MRTLTILFVGLLLGLVSIRCGAEKDPPQAVQASTGIATPPLIQPKVGVLLASHGSRSPQWRNMLTGLEDAVRARVLAIPRIDGIKTAFMEYTEPSIATRMREFDAEGYSEVIVVPLFLTVSSHSFDDIPTILFQKEDATSLKVLASENIERYRPHARVTMTSELDFSGFLRDNIRRRVKALSLCSSGEGVVLIAYGSKAYNEEWERLLLDIGENLELDPGISSTSFGWCGHLVSYQPDSTQEAIRRVLEEKEIALVIPVLVAYDEMFQTDIIGGAIAALTAEEQVRVRYLPDAILPSPLLERWVVEVAADTAAGLRVATHGRPVEASTRHP